MKASLDVDVPRPVLDAVASISDPEYPGLSIVDLGLVEFVQAVDCATGVDVVVGLIPTFSGCPALAMIAADVTSVVEAVSGVASCRVEWLASPTWSVDRISESAAARLEVDFTVVLRRKDGTLRCPVCGSDAIDDRADVGPVRCRSVAWCESCRNVVEVIR